MILLFLYTCTVFWIAAMAESDSIKKADEILEYAIQYALDGSYPLELTKGKKRAIRKRAVLLTVNKGEVFLNRGKTKAKVVVSLEKQRRVLKAFSQAHMIVDCLRSYLPLH